MNHKENAEIVKSYLDKNEMHYMTEEREDMTVFTGQLGMKKSVFSAVQFRLCAEEKVVQIFVNPPVMAAEKIAEMVEFAARVNFSLKRGKLDVDCADGEVRFHLCVPVAAVRADPDDTLCDLLLIPLLVLMKYGKGITEILFADADAKTAYGHCENCEV